MTFSDGHQLPTNVAAGDPNHYALHNAERVAINDLDLRTRYGSGSPLGAVVAPIGTEYVDLSATLGARRWYKAALSDSSGWVVVEGDTGWREVSSLLGSGATNGSEQNLIRRICNQVELRLACQNTAWTSGSPIIQIPSGFRPHSAWYMPNTTYDSSAPFTHYCPGTQINRYGTAAYGQLRYTWTWTVDDLTWPVVLPGSAA